jgi:hypothetical protein
MPKVSERERIAALELKLKQLKVQKQRKEARARTVEGRRTRREELRRKILVGLWGRSLAARGSVDPSLGPAGKTSCFSRPDPQARVPTCVRSAWSSRAHLHSRDLHGSSS